MERFEWLGTVEPDYFQSYVRRGDAPWVSDEVGDDGYRDRLWTKGGFVYVGTARKFGTLPISVTVRDQPDEEGLGDWQHIVEVSVEGKGPLNIHSWPGDEPVTVAPAPAGPLRLRVAWYGLVAGRFEGLDEDGESDERLALTVWPAAPKDSVVVRRWDGWP